MAKLKISCLGLFCILHLFANAQPQITLNLFATGLSNPVDIKNCGDNRLFVVEKDGYIQILDVTGSKNATPFLDINNQVNSSGGEQGLLGLAFSPNYTTDGFFYVNYIDNNSNTRICRYSVNPSNPDLADASSEEILLTVNQPYSNHNGGSLAFGADNYLYMALGDGGSAGDPGNRSQNKKEFLGKMLRIDVSSAPGYSIPASNPFVGDSSYFPEIFALGLRNPWRFSVDKMSGDLWIGDVGQNAWEEINHHVYGTPGGMNYGWRCYEGTVAYNTTGCNIASFYEPPVMTYQHSGTNGCSVTGGYVYRGAQYAELFGKYLYTDFCSGNIWAIENNNGTYTNLLLGNFADNQYGTFGEDQYGELYIAELYSGDIYKIEETSCLPTAYITESDSIVICGNTVTMSTPAGPGLTYKWKLNGTNIPGATAATYTATQSGIYSVRVTNTSNCNNLSNPVVVVINNNPVVSFTGVSNLYCINNNSVSLQAQPAGGTFSGPAVSGNIFNPSQAGIGSHNIHYTYTDPNGCTGSKTKNITVDACALVNESGAAMDIRLSPNPVNGTLFLELPEETGSLKELVISDLLGKIILNKTELAFTENKIVLNLTDQPKGIYLMNLKMDEKQYIRKFVIQ